MNSVSLLRYIVQMTCAVIMLPMMTQVRRNCCETAAYAQPSEIVAISSTRPVATSRQATQPDLSPLIDALIFPGHSTQGTPEAMWRSDSHDTLLKLISKDGVRINAVFGQGVHRDKNTHEDSCMTLIYFYGNGTCLANSRQVFNEFRKLGYDVIMPDYEGYGMSGGKPSETGCYAAADAAYDYLLTRPDLDKQKIVVVGWSLGTAVAIDLASRRPVAGLITFSAFTSLSDAAGNIAPGISKLLLPSSWFDSLEKIPDISCPILMFHGTTDTLIPPGMSDRLASAAKAKVTLIHVSGAGHNDIFVSGGQSLFQQVRKFLNGLKANTPTTRTSTSHSAGARSIEFIRENRALI